MGVEREGGGWRKGGRGGYLDNGYQLGKNFVPVIRVVVQYLEKR
jgi:hypothetical protein